MTTETATNRPGAAETRDIHEKTNGFIVQTSANRCLKKGEPTVWKLLYEKQ